MPWLLYFPLFLAPLYSERTLVNPILDIRANAMCFVTRLTVGSNFGMVMCSRRVQSMCKPSWRKLKPTAPLNLHFTFWFGLSEDCRITGCICILCTGVCTTVTVCLQTRVSWPLRPSYLDIPRQRRAPKFVVCLLQGNPVNNIGGD